jgi:hypothetical protein
MNTFTFQKMMLTLMLLAATICATAQDHKFIAYGDLPKINATVLTLNL